MNMAYLIKVLHLPFLKFYPNLLNRLHHTHVFVFLSIQLMKHMLIPSRVERQNISAYQIAEILAKIPN
ncbi:hypothetical protein RclHR1_03590011 [Rhizophagus clarus]|uniref:Uncharacterized protein n=1 Tax=Rhizophagus clarus TaxID=94130 RepID=A0A2Z6S5Z5_9GLOM|nr:hypothetical protein RclHR1_03590011 [Rhizophagus clarus]